MGLLKNRADRLPKAQSVDVVIEEIDKRLRDVRLLVAELAVRARQEAEDEQQARDS